MRAVVRVYILLRFAGAILRPNQLTRSGWKLESATMSSELIHGVPIPQEEILCALRSAAVPGYTGSLQVGISVNPEAARHVMIDIIRRQSRTAADTTREKVPVVGDHLRKNGVLLAMQDLKLRLVLRPVMVGFEAHFDNGELKRWTVSE